MKKVILTTLLIFTTALTACGNSNEQSKTQETEVVTEQEATEQIEVDETLLSVEINVPSTFIGDVTQEELTADAQEKGYKSITLNEDGSATYKMTKGQHRELMKELAATMKEELNKMVESEDYPNFKSIEYNKDYTNFTITTTSTELDMAESFSTLAFYLWGGMYNVFNGTPVDNVHVDFVNADSGEIIESGDSSEMGE